MSFLKQCDHRWGCTHEFPEHYYSNICGDFHLPPCLQRYEGVIKPRLWQGLRLWRRFRFKMIGAFTGMLRKAA